MTFHDYRGSNAINLIFGKKVLALPCSFVYRLSPYPPFDLLLIHAYLRLLNCESRSCSCCQPSCYHRNCIYRYSKLSTPPGEISVSLLVPKQYKRRPFLALRGIIARSAPLPISLGHPAWIVVDFSSTSHRHEKSSMQ